MLSVLAVALVLGACGRSATSGGSPPGSSKVADYHYAVPVDQASPWPEMRHDQANTGESPIVAHYDGGKPWSFPTGNSIFSTPVIGGHGTVYVGSADHSFYAISSAGHLAWKFETGNLIDSAAVLGQPASAGGPVPVTVGSGDDFLYKLRTSPADLSPAARVVWKYQAPPPPSAGQKVSWWEGNVEMGYGGTLLAGNTGGAAYALHPDGTLAWRYAPGNSVWTAAAVAPDGSTYWGSLSGTIFALDRNGHLEWTVGTLGFVIASPALGTDGTLYGASFDGKVYAIDAANGKVEWTYPTADNIYGSPALITGPSGRTTAIVVASTDGSVYALSPSGQLIWRYDTGAVIRSSPAVGAAPPGDPAGHIVYVGAADGRLYAIDASSGQRRWSFDTTSTNPVARDRNQLNSSPALGTTGVVIGSEDGSVWSVPYDYCLHAKDPRCSVGPGAPLPADATVTYLVTPSGATEATLDPTTAATSVLPFRLVVRRKGVALDAGFDARNPPRVTIDPSVPFTTALSGDGHDLFVVPQGFLQPGAQYRVTISGDYKVAPPPLGDGSTGAVQTTLRLSVPATGAGPLPLSVGRNSVSALDLTGMAIPLPAFLSSVNAIGFDSYDWIVSTLSISPPDGQGDGHVLLFVVGAKRGAGGSETVDPATSFAFPLEGTYHGNMISVASSDVSLTFSFGSVPMQEFMLRMQLNRKLDSPSPPSLYGVSHCADIPYYGPLLLSVTDLCNASGDLVASGMYQVSGLPTSPAATRPSGVSVGSMTLTRPSGGSAGSFGATVNVAAGMRYPAAAHVVTVVLTDAKTGALVPLDYHALTTVTTGATGQLDGVTLRIPAGTTLPAGVTATVVTDAFPLATEQFGA